MATYLVWRNKVISMIRGDSFSFRVRIPNPHPESSEYEITNNLIPSQNRESIQEIPDYILSEGDLVYFFLSRPNDSFEQAFLVKKYTYENQDPDGYIRIELTPEDTAYIHPGDYYYTVKLAINAESSEEEIYTIIPKTKFLIVD